MFIEIALRKLQDMQQKKEKDVFDKDKLTSIVNNLNKKYCVTLIDKEIFDELNNLSWSRDLCGNYADYSFFSRIALGVVVTYNGEIVSGASAYSAYKDGIEIEIDTRENIVLLRYILLENKDILYKKAVVLQNILIAKQRLFYLEAYY